MSPGVYVALVGQLLMYEKLAEDIQASKDPACEAVNRILWKIYKQ
jgi:hypothetical protein